mmetsp:Transcript_111709/g.215181  ORF Transcript_111709/g.215181 Transcript_111709/m.215181 type:complete len:89 (+) Transcript_111709:252-518(+)
MSFIRGGGFALGEGRLRRTALMMFWKLWRANSVRYIVALHGKRTATAFMNLTCRGYGICFATLMAPCGSGLAWKFRMEGQSFLIEVQL